MATNIVCSDTYINAFSKLDKKTQKRSLETIRLMQRSLRSDSLKIEKLNTKLDFKSVRVTHDFRAIFTQSGNTILLVYIDHHDDAYLWASKRLHGFDTASTKPAYEYFEQSKIKDFYTSADETVDSKSENKSINKNSAARTLISSDESDKNKHEIINTYDSNLNYNTTKKLSLGLFTKITYFLFGIISGISISFCYFKLI